MVSSTYAIDTGRISTVITFACSPVPLEQTKPAPVKLITRTGIGGKVAADATGNPAMGTIA
jgi:hypothetical protein